MIKGVNQNPTDNVINHDKVFFFMTGNKVKTYGPSSTIQNYNKGLSAVRRKKRKNKRQIEIGSQSRIIFFKNNMIIYVKKNPKKSV